MFHHFFLEPAEYTWKNALCWGNFAGHYKKVSQGHLQNRIVHLLIASIEFLPVISQIVSIFEKCIVTIYHSSLFSHLCNRRISLISTDTKKENTANNNTSATIRQNETTLKKVQLTAQTIQGNNRIEQAQEVEISCGSKHDRLVQMKSMLTAARIPTFFGFTNEQIQRLLSDQTRHLWNELTKSVHLKKDAGDNYFTNKEIQSLISRLQLSVVEDILISKLPLTPAQEEILKDLKGKTLIIRSSSHEDDKAVNAGGNKSVGGVSVDNLKQALSLVVKSYFSLQSFKNRSAVEDPFAKFPLCSVLVMEQMIEEQTDRLPLVSGVMMTNKTAWTACGEEEITHISASWGFSSGTHNETVCDEWAMTSDRTYATIRHKPHRLAAVSIETTKKEINLPSLIRAPCLTEEQLRQLKNVSEQLEAYFKQSMDVEFVIKNDCLYIVQVRPNLALNVPSTTTYIDPISIIGFSHVCEGEMIVNGSNRALFLERDQILFESNLEKAEKHYEANVHQAVVVYTKESSNTHPAINFASQNIPCLVLPHNKWLACSRASVLDFFHLCPQSGILIQTQSKLPVLEGLFLHPAHFLVSVGDSNSIQAESHHPCIKRLKALLRAVPEMIKTRIDEIELNLTQIFEELSKRIAITTNLIEITKKLKQACFDEVNGMKKAANSRTRLAFHAGILRQLVGQVGSQVIGAHSISGLESATNLTPEMQAFIHKYKESQLLCELALLGQHSFDAPTQQAWLSFLNLEENHQEEALKQLLKDLQELDTLGMIAHWFLVHFTSSTPKMDQLLVENTKNKENYATIFALKALAETMNQARSAQELKHAWVLLQEHSNAFLNFCGKNHPFMMDLIDLWDLSAKIVRTSHLFHENEENEFRARVDAFIEFALQASQKNTLNYSLIGLVREMQSSGRSDFSFSVQHWLIPISHGALARLRTDDQRLTVIHQNLLQAVASDNIEMLPSRLKNFYLIFKEENTCRAKRFSADTGTFFSIEKDRITIKINVPLNFHSTVISISQRKKTDEIEMTVYFRASDNPRGQHLNFFRIFSKLTGIFLKDSDIINSDLQLVFTLENEEQARLLSKATNLVNISSLTMTNDIEALHCLLDPEDAQYEVIEAKIAACLWKELQQTGIYIDLGGDGILWKFLKDNGQLPELINRVIAELKGEQSESDYSKHFTKRILKNLSPEKCRELVWQDFIGKQNISNYWVPENIRNELLERLFKEMPVKAQQKCRYTTPDIFVRLMSDKLATSGLQTLDELHLLFHMALNCYYAIPEQWIKALKERKEDIQALINEKKKDRSFLYWVQEKQLDRLLGIS